jgi:hypothetical protein
MGVYVGGVDYDSTFRGLRHEIVREIYPRKGRRKVKTGSGAAYFGLLTKYLVD